MRVEPFPLEPHRASRTQLSPQDRLAGVILYLLDKRFAQEKILSQAQLSLPWRDFCRWLRDALYSPATPICIRRTTGTIRTVDPDTGFALLHSSAAILQSNPSGPASDGANQKLRRQRLQSAPHGRPTQDAHWGATVDAAGTAPLASGDPRATRFRFPQRCMDF